MNEHLILGILAGYFIGSVPFGLILSRTFGFGDLRKVGSGNIGATNALRAGGLKLALAVLILDALKGFLSVLFFGVWAGLAAVIGHNYPVWLKFKGGKGFATTAGFSIAISPVLFLASFAVWFSVAVISGYSSLAALVTLLVAPALWFKVSSEVGWAVAILSLLGFWRHRENIKRLVAGTESKIGSNKNKKKSK